MVCNVYNDGCGCGMSWWGGGVVGWWGGVDACVHVCMCGCGRCGGCVHVVDV